MHSRPRPMRRTPTRATRTMLLLLAMIVMVTALSPHHPHDAPSSSPSSSVLRSRGRERPLPAALYWIYHRPDADRLLQSLLKSTPDNEPSINDDATTKSALPQSSVGYSMRLQSVRQFCTTCCQPVIFILSLSGDVSLFADAR